MLPSNHLLAFLVTIYVLILIPGQLISLGLICVLVALLSDGAWALASGTARRWLGSSPRRLEQLSAGGGLTLIALGAGLALTGRKD